MHEEVSFHEKPLFSQNACFVSFVSPGCIYRSNDSGQQEGEITYLGQDCSVEQEQNEVGCRVQQD